MTIKTYPRPSGSGALCRSILDELPDWFGLPQSNAEYARLAEEGPCWIAEADGEPVGLMILKRHGVDAVENYLLAVRPAAHRHGVGKALIARAMEEAAASGAVYLTVKTRGPSIEYEPYARTRAFYRARGFVALEEFDQIWGPQDPCLFMVRPVGRA